MYQGSHLHMHFSGAVTYRRLISILKTSQYRDKLFWNYKTRALSFVHTGKRSNMDAKVWRLISNIINAPVPDPYDKFRIIGDIFYGIIKDDRFYPTYIEMIHQDMISEGIEHLELRLQLGSLMRSNHKEKVYSIQDELDILYQKISDLGVSIKIIPQFNRYRSDDDIYKYFMTIIRYVAENPQYRSLVVAFDIAGNEKHGRSLRSMESVLYRILSEMNELRISYGYDPSWMIPFFFHAGEVSEGIDNVRFSIEFCKIFRSYSPDQSLRIGHGIYGMHDQQIVSDIRSMGITLEICPLSMIHLKNIPESMMSLVYQHRDIITINADDPNKLGDLILEDNISFLRSNGFSDEDIYRCFRLSILASQCDDDHKQHMMHMLK